MLVYICMHRHVWHVDFYVCYINHKLNVNALEKKKKMKLPFGSSVGRIPGDQMHHNENYTSAQSYIAIY